MHGARREFDAPRRSVIGSATSEAKQLAAIGWTEQALTKRGIDYWLFGGWAVDFYAGGVSRPHDDVDIAVWLDDRARIAELLETDGWTHAPEEDEDGGTGYERDGVRLELTFLVRDADGEVFIPLRSGPARWSKEAFGSDVAELRGVCARVIALAELRRGKSQVRGDAADAAKDRADSETLSRPR